MTCEFHEVLAGGHSKVLNLLTLFRAASENHVEGQGGPIRPHGQKRSKPSPGEKKIIFVYNPERYTN